MKKTFYDPELDKLVSIMTCTTCRKIVQPELIFRCLVGHVYCDKCKGGNLTDFGKHCEICKGRGKKRKIRPNRILKEANPHIEEAQKFKEKCSECSEEYFNLGNGKKEHYSQHIANIWDL